MREKVRVATAFPIAAPNVRKACHTAQMKHSNTPLPPNPQPPGFRVSADRPLALLGACPVYQPTPLTIAPDLARALGVAGLWVKDETARMQLGSFKALGGAFAVVQMILDRADMSDPRAPEAVAVASDLTFVTASAGNHGLSVAAGAKIFGANAAILLPAAAPEAFATRIRGKGAEVIRVDGSYEDSVAEAMRLAEARGWLHLADGSWPGYTAPPALVLEGYMVLAEECRQSFAALGAWPSHVVVQAGVGGLAAALAAHIRATWPRQPEIIVVEPDAAPCLMQSLKVGKLTSAEGPVSIMGRLDCKEASMLAFESLRDTADTFVTISDAQAREAVRALAQAGIATTPSGAAGMAALRILDLPADATCLIVASEGPEDA